MRGKVFGRRPGNSYPWSPCVPGCGVARLRVHDVANDSIEGAEAAGAPCPLGDGCVVFPTQSVVDRHVRSSFPVVFSVCVVVAPIISGWANVGATRNFGR